MIKLIQLHKEKPVITSADEVFFFFLWAEETSKYSWSRFCTVNCRPLVGNYQLSHIRIKVCNSDLWFVSNMLSCPIICVDNNDGACKILSQ